MKCVVAWLTSALLLTASSLSVDAYCKATDDNDSADSGYNNTPKQSTGSAVGSISDNYSSGSISDGSPAYNGVSSTGSSSSAYGGEQNDSISDSTSSSVSGSVSASSSASSSGSVSAPSSSSSSSESSADSVGSGSGDDTWKFKPVTSVQVRVQGNLPAWDADHDIFVSEYGSDFEAKYIGVTDTVNMAAVEGAFKYVQAECINLDVIKNCTRKNNIKYIAFYETKIVQPRAAMAYYQNDTTGKTAIEHCPFIPMDGGQCTPTNGVFPKECDQFTGVNGQPELGFCVGGSLQDSDFLAPYTNNYWFSYPNSCPREVWANKTTECRKQQAGGLCELGVEPDGVTCSFSYKILGYIGLDDVVGITSMVNPLTGKKYADYYEFCRAGGIEYNVLADSLLSLLNVVTTIPFWSEPSSRARNQERVDTLVKKYNALVSSNPKTSDGGVMQPLPSIAELTKQNPHCYENNVRCAEAEFGCRRTLFSQICEICTEAADDCVVKPAGYTFPTL